MIFALGTFSSASHAICYGKGIQHAPTINVDLSDKLSPTSPTWSTTYNIQFSGSFTCTTSSSEFGYTEMLSPNDAWATVLGFNNGKYYVKAQITNVIGNKKLSGKGSHNASELGRSWLVYEHPPLIKPHVHVIFDLSKWNKVNQLLP